MREVLPLTEEHDIVYRENPRADAPVPKPQPAPTDEAFSREIVPDPVLLFRYSALTFNGHRIHYDRPYVTEVEGYPGLIVHGPLDRDAAARPGAKASTPGSRAPLQLSSGAPDFRHPSLHRLRAA